MKFLFYISGDSPELARQEIKALGIPTFIRRFERVVVADCSLFDFKRLAFAIQVSKFLFCIRADSSVRLEKKLSSFNWGEVCKGSFAVRAKGLPKWASERMLAGMIWNSLSNPKVNLSNPDTQINFYFYSGMVFCGINLYSLSHDFESRKPHKRPGFHPTSLSPKVAAAMINITGAMSSVWDPFCGTGGILLEAGLMGLKAVGSDLDKKMLELAEKNLKHYGVINFRLVRGNAFSLNIRAEAIVSDLPYGKGSKLNAVGISSLSLFYSKFIERLIKIVKRGKLVVMIPDFVLIRCSAKPMFETKIYVHKSLTRRILLF